MPVWTEVFSRITAAVGAMGCCGSAEEEPIRFQRPTTGINNMQDYTHADENLDDPTLVARVREMVDSDPDSSVHRLNYAILMTQVRASLCVGTPVVSVWRCMCD